MRKNGGDPKPWVPLRRSTWIPPTAEKLQQFVAELERLGSTHDEAVQIASDEMLTEPEIYKNLHVTVTVERYDDSGDVRVIHVRRNDRKPIRDWRMMQRIKNEIAGPEVEGVELYPAESRLVDTANSYWVWCLPAGQVLEVGFEKRAVDYDEERAARMGARQRGLGSLDL